jgi:hypothetical protein
MPKTILRAFFVTILIIGPLVSLPSVAAAMTTTMMILRR